MFCFFSNSVSAIPAHGQLCPILLVRAVLPGKDVILLGEIYLKLFQANSSSEAEKLSMFEGLETLESLETIRRCESSNGSPNRSLCSMNDIKSDTTEPITTVPHRENLGCMRNETVDNAENLQHIQRKLIETRTQLELLRKVTQIRAAQQISPFHGCALGKLLTATEEDDGQHRLPNIPPNIIGSVIAPFLSDRVTFNNVKSTCSEVYEICRTLNPPWPTARLSAGIPLWSVAFSPDANILACGGGDGIIRLWHRRDGPMRRLRGHLGRVYSIVFAPRGDTMATGSGDGGIRIWNMIDYSCVELERQTPHVDCLAFSVDGRTLASGGDGVIRLWNVESARCIAAITEENRVVETVAFSPDGQTLASGNWGHTIHLWDLESTVHECVAILNENTCIHSISYSPDGKYMASASDNAHIRLWNLTDQSYSVLNGHEDSVWSVVFSPDGKRIASGSDDGNVRVWNPINGECTVVIDSHNSHSVYCVAFASDYRTIASVSDGGYCQLSEYNAT